MIGRTDKLVYAVSQTARVGWFYAQYMLAFRMGHRAQPDRPTRRRATVDGLRFLARELRALMVQDLRNIEAGHYRMPHDLVTRPSRAVRDALRFLRDVPEVTRRRREQAGAEVFRAPPAGSERLPDYFRQNFHFQTDGYLSPESARLYDHQVEVLFAGGADAMRRQALVPIAEYFRTHPAAGASLVDVACGTGRFLTFVRDNYPWLAVTGIDLSRPYLDEARRSLAAWPTRARFVQAAAEALPLPDDSQDLITCIYLFHELPAAVRAAAAAEFRRVLKPGGRLVFVDSLQAGDRPALDPLLQRFPQDFHEPYYDDYIRQDLRQLFAGAGLSCRSENLAFLSKVMVFEK